MEIKKVIKNGQVYTLPSGGEGGANIIRLTQAEYDALVESKTIDENAIYVIEDAESNYYNKEEVDVLIENATPANYSTISGYAENAVAGFNTNNLTNYNQLTYRKSTGSTYYSIVNFPKLKINGTNNNILGNSNLIDLDTYTDGKVATKQDKLVSGTNIKTINNQSILGNGNITIQGGGGSNVINLTQAEYDALTEKDPNVIYNITDATDIDVYTKEEVDELIEEIQLYKFPNVTIFGQPTIQNGQVSNFSNSNYLQFPFLVDFQNRPFDIYFSFTTPSNLSGQQNILDSNYGLAFAIRDGKVVCVASDNGTSWTTGELISVQTLTPNTTYYFRISWVRGTENPFLSIVGGLSKDDTTISMGVITEPPYPKTMIIGRSYVDGGNYFKGSINLNDASLEISDKVVWQGMDDVGLATRLAVDMSNLDDKGKEVIDDRIDAKIGNINSILENIIGG